MNPVRPALIHLQGLLSEAHQIYKRLAEIDPMRRGYYSDALSGSARVTIQEA